MKLEYGLDCIMIDYLQLMSAGSGRKDFEQTAGSERRSTPVQMSLSGTAPEIWAQVTTAGQLRAAPALSAYFM